MRAGASRADVWGSDTWGLDADHDVEVGGRRGRSNCPIEASGHDLEVSFRLDEQLSRGSAYGLDTGKVSACCRHVDTGCIELPLEAAALQGRAAGGGGSIVVRRPHRLLGRLELLGCGLDGRTVRFVCLRCVIPSLLGNCEATAM
jgi:hypothetical protein